MVTRKVELDSAYAQSVLGINDDNVRVLEDQLGVGFHARGTQLTVKGHAEQAAHALRVVEELESMARDGLSGGWEGCVRADGSLVMENNGMFCSDHISGFSVKTCMDY